VSTETITIIDAKSKEPIEATLHRHLTPQALIDVEAAWGPARVAAAKKQLQLRTRLPEHWHWDWSSKQDRLRLLAYRCFGIECRGAMQGLMMVNVAGYSAVLPPDVGKPLVYIEFIESAPWNISALVDKPRFSGIGSRLVRSAILFSKEEGFHGRIGLHSLEQSEQFYSETCGMTKLHLDPRKESLRYLELTRKQADVFLGGGRLR